MNSRRILQLPLRAPISRVPVFSRTPLRNASTAAPETTSAQPSRWTRRLIYAAVFGALGVSAGKLMDDKIAAPPLPGSLEDQIALQEIQRIYDTRIPIVQKLRDSPDWTESSVYEDFTEKSKSMRLTSGSLAGSRGFGLQVSCHGV